MPVTPLSAALLAWFDRHGRKDLPWQRDPTPYRVWVSEIMLQQTQVATVIPYYARFMQRFPTVTSLADAPLDAVLHEWTGLGYYARARNLQRAAQMVRDRHGGELPRDIEALQRLPGIGRSTAGAILALAYQQCHPILDGNVKRVLTRLHALPGWPGARAVESELWKLAAAHTPAARVAHYTQAIMDLGATVCTRTRPACPACPLRAACAAHTQDRVADYPAPKPRKALPTKHTTLLMVCNEHGAVLLEQRPPAGIWGGLWSLPEYDAQSDAHLLAAWCAQRYGYTITDLQSWPVLRHSFSHFHLDITPVRARVAAVPPARTLEPRHTVWYNSRTPDARGLAAPVKRLLTTLSDQRKERP